MASIIDGYHLGAGGWYRTEDNSGPYAIDDQGNASLISGAGASEGNVLLEEIRDQNITIIGLLEDIKTNTTPTP